MNISYVLYALVDPEQFVAHVLHTTEMEVLDTIHRPVLTTRPYRDEYNRAAAMWYGYKSRARVGPRQLGHQNMAEWFDSMIERKVAPLCKLIEFSYREIPSNDVKKRKMWAIKTLNVAGFEVLTSNLGVRPPKRTFDEDLQRRWKPVSSEPVQELEFPSLAFQERL